MGKPCAEYRAAARNALRNNYWYSFGLCLLVSLITGLVSGVVSSIAAAAGIALAIFVLMPLSVGLVRYFILRAKGTPSDVNELGYVFKNNYMGVVGTLVKKGIFIYLWTLLFVVPGIIKSYSYLMIDYMLAENPNMTSKRAFEISKAAMLWRARRTL